MAANPARVHLYSYTVEIRLKDGWERRTVQAYNIVQAAYKLGVKLDDLRYVHKQRAKEETKMDINPYQHTHPVKAEPNCPACWKGKRGVKKQ